MYTGIIEHTASVRDVRRLGAVLELRVDCDLRDELAIDQSVAHNGVCLTITDIDRSGYAVQAVPETLARTTLGDWQPGQVLNIERCMPVTGRLDGHLVQGHVDTHARVVDVVEGENHRRIRIELPEAGAHLVAEKGSICVDGIGLTVASVTDDAFDVALIPRTLELTNGNTWAVGSRVNLEYDVIARYLDRRVRVGVHHDDV